MTWVLVRSPKYFAEIVFYNIAECINVYATFLVTYEIGPYFLYLKSLGPYKTENHANIPRHYFWCKILSVIHASF